MSLQRYCFEHKRVVELRHEDLHTACDVGDAFITRAGPDEKVQMTASEWREADEAMRCEHAHIINLQVIPNSGDMLRIEYDVCGR